jgi:hypothetical protein
MTCSGVVRSRPQALVPASLNLWARCGKVRGSLGERAVSSSKVRSAPWVRRVVRVFRTVLIVECPEVVDSLRVKVVRVKLDRKSVV